MALGALGSAGPELREAILLRGTERRGVTGKERMGIYVRRNTPAPVVDAASRAIIVALQDPELRAAIEKMSYYETRGSTPQEFDGYIRAEFKKWQAVVKASGFTPEE